MAASASFPRRFGLLLYPEFEVLDVAGPIEALIGLSQRGYEDMKLSIISHTLDPVSPGLNEFGRAIRYLPTHTFETAPQLDVLLVPGGLGTIEGIPSPDKPRIDEYVDYVRKAYRGYVGHEPLQYIFSVCNGALVLGKAGVLDGHKATTNKAAWKLITPSAPKAHWVASARWVESGNVWTTSGVSAGADGMLAWMASLLPDKIVTEVADGMEWQRVWSSDDDPFAELNGCEDVLPEQD
ncbi:hypothetical protein LTS10_009256 [Elasticomyces elasticus]|nr:hypothetical protein LTS10_009256 [Elasticomyces elasticus]